VGVDLSAFAGMSVRVRFIFQTSDKVDNANEGIYLDDIEISESNCKKDCMGAYDCPADWVCTTAECKGNLCDITDIGGDDCCVVKEDCNDNEKCTADSCVENLCYHEFVESSECCQAYDIASYNLDGEDYNSIFSISDDGSGVKWNVTDFKFKSAPRSLMFGTAGQGFGEGKTVTGNALSPEITLPDNAVIHLSFALYLDVETDPAKDKFTVSVVENYNPVAVFTKESVPEVAYKKWFDVSAIDVSDYKGKKVKIRFSFDSVDSGNNSGAGVFVDDILVKKVCP
ncbi:MAG: hypothetical protein FJ088_05865, partial [Deltaproteobacteria bacterium]|nr:hypothetical protein [Deltaproteobacteria bacterium]